jgi:hypothetical protein
VPGATSSGGRLAHQGAQRVAQRPHGTPQRHQVAAHGVELVHRLAAGAAQDLVLQQVQPLGVRLHHGKAVVHHRVQDGVGEVVRPGGADAATRAADAVAHRVQRIAGRSWNETT